MIQYLEYLHTPERVIVVCVAILAVGLVLNGFKVLWEYVAPILFGIKTKVSKRKEFEEAVIASQDELKILGEKQDIDRKASKQADKQLEEKVHQLGEKLDVISDAVLQMRVDSMRKEILDFGSCVAEKKRHYTKERYEEVFRTIESYHRLLERHSMTNGFVDMSVSIIEANFQWCMENHGFLEDKTK